MNLPIKVSISHSKLSSLASLMVGGMVLALSPHQTNAASGAWFDMPGGKMRLITAAQPDSREISAALEVRLEKGWKTYWRAPGDSGIPPSFEFPKSRNVQSARVGFPTPSHFTVNGSEIVGYKNQVVFPIKVLTTMPDQPTELKLELVIGICAEICVPVQASLSLTEHGTGSPSFEVARLLADAAQTLPSSPTPDFRITGAFWQKENPKKLRIKAVVPEAANTVQLHVEGPEEWYLPSATVTDRQGAETGFLLDISDIPGNANPGQTPLRFTLVADSRSIEQTLVPDKTQGN